MDKYRSMTWYLLIHVVVGSIYSFIIKYNENTLEGHVLLYDMVFAYSNRYVHTLIINLVQ